MRFFLIFVVFGFIGLISHAQTFTFTLNWTPNKIEKLGNNKITYLYFEGANYSFPGNPIPCFVHEFKINSSNFSVELKNVITEVIAQTDLNNIDLSNIKTDFELKSNVYFQRKVPFLNMELIPVRKNTYTGNYERIRSFEVVLVNKKNANEVKAYTPQYASNSVFSNGRWKKIKITQSGIYKLTYAQIVSLGFTNPQNIKIYGNGGAQLPYYNNVPIVDDVQQIPIYIYKGNDNIFNDGDYILFYAKAPVYWTYNASEQTFVHAIHHYTDESYYFLTDDGVPATTMSVIDENGLTYTQTVNTFNDYVYHELESVNFIKSGRTWVGESFSNNLTQSFTFTMPNIVSGSNATIKAVVYGRSNVTNSFNFSLNGQALGSQFISALNYSGTGNYANGETFKKTITLNASNSLNFSITYNKPAQGGEGWLDYFEINVRRNLIFSGGQMFFRDALSVGTGNVAQFQLTTNNPQTIIWDVTNPLNPAIVQSNINGNTLTFNASTSNLREFIAFDGTNFYTPTVVGDVANQNLHGLGHVDMIIVSHPDFLSAANELADLHRQMDNLIVEVVTPEMIYNEFSSGMPDVSAIKYLMKMLYDRAGNDSASMPKYLLLMGDGSYDNRHYFSGNTNYILTYQSVYSNAPVSSFTTDDYFGMLDSNEYEYIGKLDISVGRLPVKSISEANTVVKKIKNYVSSNSLGDWRNTLTFVADDEDSNEHIGQSNALATMVDTLYPQYNLDKIYLDAFQQESTPTGDRYPDAHDAIEKRMKKGTLVFNYTGHGNEYALTHEHVIINTDITQWTNFNTLPLFITATCEFSHWDDYNRTSAGELVLLNPQGGSIAMFSTTRLVYSTSNFALNKSFFDYLYKRTSSGEYMCIGDIYRLAKNQTGGLGDINKRNFSLLGDPALRLAYPKHIIITDSINGKPLSNFTDTIKPLQRIKIKGHVENIHHQLLSNYSGTILVTVFDKPISLNTLANDGGTPFPFTIQNNVLFKGQATVNNGYFSLEFIMPKDIQYTSGFGKISYYAMPNSGIEDATGFFNELSIGGEADSLSDNQGPIISLYMNNENFVNGGTTNESPNLIVHLYDENGINSVSSSIGHDICAYIDGNYSKKIVLSDNYISEKDNYKKGKIIYGLSNLTPGEHKITVKAWDVANNSSESSLNFTVVSSEKLSLDKVLNYPNPFSTKTSFYFEHNQADGHIQVIIQVYTITGKVVKTISNSFYSNGFRSDPIEWDGRDDFGDKLSRGVYFYKLMVKSSTGTAEKYEKLVIL
ncbi:MAG: type IX secretion system sortase PorU [Bacteroidales bacterium]|nr:type IX secretion system sortase PorU [Bacteroidales bacterium]